ncbi:DUF3263 domain-containing protein [Corynebacterium tuscaniense]|uniref:DUF3263 domain-containing protein n=1 Tax=Corynebacterium tuscaniense TaxID=302449 RepID=UPI00050D9099|nr:DUF3263 domain-containing protein [Corynebacterium tuscaniense]KAA8727975.1 DUF3263 domain-containing protein [Corynebacterium tuscaniense]KGF24532.1 hypothetical protein HMPREF2129_01380 [Corynebacterium tuscaniense DNF00037]
MEPSDLTILDFAARAPRSLGAREEAIRVELGMSPFRYYQKLNSLIDDPLALAARPQLVRRLQRIRDQRALG